MTPASSAGPLDFPLIRYQRCVVPPRTKPKPRRSILHRRIKELRAARGLAQAALAEAGKLGDKSTVAQWERGATSPRADVIPLIAAALGVGVADLYSRPVA